MPDRHERIEMLYSLRRYDKAERLAREQIVETPENSFAFAQLAMCLSVGKRDRLDEALDAARVSLKHNSHSPFTFYLLGWIQRQKHHWVDAETYFRTALKMAPDYLSPRVSLAALLFDTDRHDEARLLVTSSLRLFPGDADLLDLKLRFALHHYHLDDVFDTTNQALRSHPTDARFHFYLAREREIRGDDQERKNRRPYYLAASKSIQEALRIDPNNESYQTLKKRIDLCLNDAFNDHGRPAHRLISGKAWIDLVVILTVGSFLLIGLFGLIAIVVKTLSTPQ